MRALGCLAALMFAGSLLAQSAAPDATDAFWMQQVSGYLKDLASGSRSYFTQDAWGDNMARLRVTYDGRHSGWFAVHVDYDNEFHAGNFAGLPDFEAVRGRQSGAWLDLQRAMVDRRNAYWDTSLYRAYASLRSANVTLTAGRQRVGWGTARFWSPMDMFNPISPLQIEPDERQGVDAALVEFGSPGALRWNLVYAPQDGFKRSASAVRLSRTVRDYDFDAVVGRFGRDWTVGFDFAGQFRGAGVRSEMTYRWRRLIPGVTPFATHNALRFVVGGDYAFPSGLYLVGEYFYNQGQPGVGGNSAPDAAILLQYTNEIFTLRRHFVSGGVSYPVTPLWRVEAYTVADIAGPSVAFLPRVTHSLSANTDVSFGAQLFASSSAGEFSGLSNLVYAELVWHFR